MSIGYVAGWHRLQQDYTWSFTLRVLLALPETGEETTEL